MKRVTPERGDDQIYGMEMWLGKAEYVYFCSGCGQDQQPKNQVLQIISGLNGCEEAEFCGRCVRRLLKALEEKE